MSGSSSSGPKMNAPRTWAELAKGPPKNWSAASPSLRSQHQSMGRFSSVTSPATLQSLIAELRAVRGPMVNNNTLLLFCEALNFPDVTIASDVEITSDVEILLDFILTLLHEGSLSNCAVQDANKKARWLMFMLVSKIDIMPRSLFITDVEKDSQAIAVGGFGKVFKGKRGGQLVALKMLYQGHHEGDSIEKNLYKEALAWRSLSHRFILPLLGIYEEGPLLFLVSPFMTNGALREWRKQHAPVRVDEIQRLLLEVAQGVQYIHSEGIVHGDLHAGNVLLDSEFHCQITDFGSTRHSEAPVTRSTTALAYNYAAPELFGMCTTCCQFDCDEPHDGEDEQHKTKTMETDVYAFGCLYYAIFFNTVPFHGKSNFQIPQLVRKGVRPSRLENPIMKDFRWDLIQTCWKSNPSERPTMEEIVTVLTPPSAYVVMTNSSSNMENMLAAAQEREDHPQADGWAVVDSRARAGDLSQFGGISKAQPITTFAGKKELKLKTNSSSNMFSMLRVAQESTGNPRQELGGQGVRSTSEDNLEKVGTHFPPITRPPAAGASPSRSDGDPGPSGRASAKGTPVPSSTFPRLNVNSSTFVPISASKNVMLITDDTEIDLKKLKSSLVPPREKKRLRKKQGKRKEEEERQRCKEEERKRKEEGIRIEEEKAREEEECRKRQADELRQQEEEDAAKARTAAEDEAEPELEVEGIKMTDSPVTPESEEGELPLSKDDVKDKSHRVDMTLSVKRRLGPLDLTYSRQSPLTLARPLVDLGSVTYPPGISSPNPELNAGAKEGKFRYDRDFLLQFMSLCKEKPETLRPLDEIGLEPVDQLSLTRGSSGRSRQLLGSSASPRQVSIGGGLPGPSLGSQYQSMGQFTTSGKSGPDSERFEPADARSVSSGSSDVPFHHPPSQRTVSHRTRSKRSEKRTDHQELV